MLHEEEGDEILASIAANPAVSSQVRQFCISIMELLKVEGLVILPSDPVDGPSPSSSALLTS